MKGVLQIRRLAGRFVAPLLWVLALVMVSMPALAQPGGAGPAARVLTLEEALALGLERNRELLDTRLDAEGAAHLVREGWGAVYPRVELTTSYTRNLTVPGTFLPRVFLDPNADPDELVAVRFGADNNWALNLRFEQPLFQPAAFIGVGAAVRYQELQDEAVRGRAQGIATQVRLAYYDVLLAEEALRLSQDAVERVRRVLEETRALQRAGLASSYDVLRLEVELANLEPGVRRSLNGVAAAKRQLAVTVGLELADPFDVVGSLAALELDATPVAGDANGDLLRFAGYGAGPAEDLAVEDVVREALARRSELKQLELMERLRESELRVERSGYLPQVTLFGNYQINAQQSGSPHFFGATGADRAYGRQVGVQVAVPVFSGFQRPARVAQRRVAVRQVRAQQELTAAQVEHQVRTLVAHVAEARDRVDAQRFAVSQARRGFEIARAQRREGVGSRLELTDAELALRQSEFNYAEAVYDYLVARARLDEAAGTVPVARRGGRIAIDR